MPPRHGWDLHSLTPIVGRTCGKSAAALLRRSIRNNASFDGDGVIDERLAITGTNSTDKEDVSPRLEA